jgi:gas vesicle structural protein
MRRLAAPPRRTVTRPAGSTLADLVDHVLNKGVVLTGEVVLGVAGIDLVYLRLQAVLAAADRIQGTRRR